jgi:hypothetical protein
VTLRSIMTATEGGVVRKNDPPATLRFRYVKNFCWRGILS